MVVYMEKRIDIISKAKKDSTLARASLFFFGILPFTHFRSGQSLDSTLAKRHPLGLKKNTFYRPQEVTRLHFRQGRIEFEKGKKSV